MHINDYVFETLLGRGTFGYALRPNFISPMYIHLLVISRSVYLVRRKRDSKPFVVKEQVLNAVNALPVKVRRFHEVE